MSRVYGKVPRRLACVVSVDVSVLKVCAASVEVCVLHAVSVDVIVLRVW